MSQWSPDSTWPEFDYQMSVGSYGGTDDRFKSRRKKHPLGFSSQPKKPRPQTKRKRPA